jgi:PhnB protein
MSQTGRWLPAGFHSLTPSLAVNGAARAIEFYVKAFGATELMRVPGEDGRIAHADLRVGDSVLFVSDEDARVPNSFRAPTTLKGTSAALYLYVPDVDAAFARAVDAGATVCVPPTDMFWGDRYCQLEDPFGHYWALATHQTDRTPDEIARAQAAR